MTKEQLFEKYSIDKSHSKWESIDNWMSVEVFRIMHNGELPPENDISVLYIIEFLDKCHDGTGWGIQLMKERNDFGSLYLTAKRMVYSLSDEILKALKQSRTNQ